MPGTSKRRARRATHSEEAAPRRDPSRWSRLVLPSLILLHLAFFWRAALLRGFLLHSDICYFFDPAKALLHEALRAGRLPLWSPYLFCGYPIAAEGQIAAFYPPSLLISWLLPSPAAINWLIISHLILAAVSMYLLARALGLSPFAAWLSALTFSFSGYLFAHLHHVSLICASAWLPLVILFIDRACRGPLLPNAPLAALTYAAAALCGHPQTLFLISLTAIFWIAWRLIQSRRAAAPGALPRAAATLAITFALGLGLAAVQLLLTADLSAAAPHGQRGDLTYITSFSLLPKHLLGLLAPNWQGTPAFNTYRGEPYYWEYVLYLGLAPLTLALIGGATRRARTLALFALAALLLALAQRNPAYHFLRFLPGFADFRVPARFIFLFTFAAALLAGRGWDTIARLRSLAGPHRLLLCGIFVAGLTALDLMHFDRPLAPVADAQLYARPPRVVETIREDPAWGRSLILPPITIWADWLPAGGWAANPDGWFEARAYLPASVPQSFGLRTIGGYAGFTNPDHAPFFSFATGWALEAGNWSLLSLVGARYFALPPEAGMSGLTGVEALPFTVYHNPDAFPRAFLIGELTTADDSQEALFATLALARDNRLRRAAVVRGQLDDYHPQHIPTATLDIEEPRPESIIVHTQSDVDSFLVLNERWDPGWTARLDGRQAPLLEVDTVLMGTSLPKGEHTIEFAYRPRGLIVGRPITLISLALCALLLALPLLRRPSS
ncbi:MAG: YfhO family protein [Armatimonadota bacterium]|nr:MAG: YfhO family protein [Armatimonadota bacterium]